MAKQIGNTDLIDTWASEGSIVDPDPSKKEEGWLLGEQPPHEWMNHIQNEHGQKINRLLDDTYNEETGLNRRVIYVDTVADLQALDASGLVEGQIANVQGAAFLWDEGEWKSSGDIAAFSSRSDFLSGHVSRGTDIASFASKNRQYFLHRDTDGPIEQNNGEKWSPLGNVYPDHFEENADPGVTDMGPAIQDAINYLAEKAGVNEQAASNPITRPFFTDEEYLINTTVQWDGSFRNVVVENGFFTSTENIPMFRVGSDDFFSNEVPSERPRSTFYAKFLNNIFKCKNGDTDNAIAVQMGRANHFEVKGNWFMSFYISLDLWSCGDGVINGNWFQTDFVRQTNGKAHVRVLGSYTETGIHRPSFGVNFHHNEVLGNGSNPERMEYGVLIHCVDEFNFSNNHFNYCAVAQMAIELRKDLPGRQIFEIVSGGGNYFDGGGLTSSDHFVVKGEPDWGDGSDHRLFNIRLVNDFFRGGGAIRNGVRFALDENSGWESEYGGINRVHISNCFFSRNRAQSIIMQGRAFEKMPVVSPSVTGNTFYNGSDPGQQASYVWLNTKGATSLTGNKFLREAEESLRAALISCSSYDQPEDGVISIMASNNDASLGNHTAQNPIRITAPEGAVVIARDNVGADGTLLNGPNTASSAFISGDYILVSSIYPEGEIPTGAQVEFILQETNPGSMFLGGSPSVTRPCRTISGEPLPEGYIIPGRLTKAYYDGDNWILDREPEHISGSGYFAVRYAGGLQELCIDNFRPDWESTSNQTEPFPITFNGTPCGGVSGIRSGSNQGVSNFESIRAFGPISSSSFFIRVDGSGTNGSGSEFTLTCNFTGKWY